MRTKKDFSYFTYRVGRYEPPLFEKKDNDFKPYQPETKKLVWNVFTEENDKIVPINLFEYNWVFLKDGLLYAKKHYSKDFIKFAEHIRGWLQHEYWSRCEYETIISSWPGKSYKQEDIDELQKELDEDKESIIKNGYTYKASIHIIPDNSYKMDVYTQVMMNWDRFIEYVWNNKRLITKNKLGL